MPKLLVCTNFAQPYHTGGAERVVQQITESMTVDYGWDCSVCCQYGTAATVSNGVKVIPTGHLSEENFLKNIKEIDPDYLFVYSDWFYRWETILNNSESIRAKKSIGLVGMNRMRSLIPKNKIVADIFRKKSSQFSVLAHAKGYIDAETCRLWNIPVTIIHNSIDFTEFHIASNSFRERYNIKSKKIILCVANFFPGKGQEYLLPIIRNMQSHDVTWVFICSTLFFQFGNHLQKLFHNQCNNMNLPVVILKDIPRKDVVEAYHASDVFAFPSQTECGPIVVLEAMAAKKPWVALNVGHIPDLKGGYCVYTSSQKNGLLSFDSDVSRQFQQNISKLINNEELSISLGSEGYAQVDKEYNWEKVKEQYRDFFLNA